MSMFGWILTGYGASALVMWRPVCRILRGDAKDDEMAWTWGLVIGVVFVVTVLSFAWPVVIVGWIVGWILGGDPAAAARRLFGESQHDRVKRLEAENRELEKRVTL